MPCKKGRMRIMRSIVLQWAPWAVYIGQGTSPRDKEGYHGITSILNCYIWSCLIYSNNKLLLSISRQKHIAGHDNTKLQAQNSSRFISENNYSRYLVVSAKDATIVEDHIVRRMVNWVAVQIKILAYQSCSWFEQTKNNSLVWMCSEPRGSYNENY